MSVRAARGLTEGSPQVDCTKCLSKAKCTPCALPWYEIIVDSIPGFGIIPSAIGWSWRHCKIQALDKEFDRAYQEQLAPQDLAQGADNFMALSSEDQEGATPIGEIPSDLPLPTDALSDSEQGIRSVEPIEPHQPAAQSGRLMQRNLLAAKRAGSAALFWTNVLIISLAAGIIGAVRRYD